MHVDDHEALEMLRPLEKIRHWSGKNPWEGVKLSHKPPIGAGEFGFDSLGNITDIPQHVGKPCLGQMGAFARHGAITKFRMGDGSLRPTRCGRCSTRGACERMFTFRLGRHPELRSAYARFQGAGGALGLLEPKLHPEALPMFEAFERELIRHGGFTSVNDSYVASNYVEKRAKLLAEDADRKRTERRKRLSAGVVDEALFDLLLRHRTYRQGQLKALKDDASARTHLPPRLNRIPQKTIQTTADVWFANELLRAKRLSVNPSSIAASMIEQWPDRYQGKNVLRGRVPKDLLRIHELEKFVLPGRSAPIWEKFEITKAVSDDEITPYVASL